MSKMRVRTCCCILICLSIFVSSSQAVEVSSSQEGLSSLIKILEPVDSLSSGLFVLIPSSLNLTDIFDHDSDFSLFKLDTGVLVQPQQGQGDTRKRRSVDSDPRNPRKINLFQKLFNKPKFSPLYLINGTVCRFVSTGPVCTTISTNGLPGLNQQQQQFGNQQPFNQQGQQQQQPFQNQGQFNSNQQQQQPFNNQQQQNQPGFNTNQQQLRPAGLMDDDTPEINVSKIANATSAYGSRVFKSNLLKHQTEIPSVSLGPANLGPLSVLPPSRTHRQPIDGSSLSSSSSRYQQQNVERVRKED